MTTIMLDCPICERRTVRVYVEGDAVDQWLADCPCGESRLVDDAGYDEAVVEAADEQIRRGAHTYAEHLAGRV